MNEHTHTNLWLYRRKCGFPRKWVALLLGHRSASLISEYERGIKTPPLLAALKLQLIYGAPFVELFPGLQSLASAEVSGVRQRYPYIAEREKRLLQEAAPSCA